MEHNKAKRDFIPMIQWDLAKILRLKNLEIAGCTQTSPKFLIIGNEVG